MLNVSSKEEIVRAVEDVADTSLVCLRAWQLTVVVRRKGTPEREQERE